MKNLIKQLTLIERVVLALHLAFLIVLMAMIGNRNADVAVALSVAVPVLILTCRPFLRAKLFIQRFARS
ncbi:MAG TPA: hypothetical protein VFK03_00770 [Candidatus Saccharimonadales bacterium]|nr:hypothetical protein [Candidatus Saccharimonadales bacterium]